MGFFSSKYKYYQGISFMPLRSDPFIQDKKARHQIFFGTKYNVERTMTEFWKYKKGNKNTLRDKTFDDNGAFPTASLVGGLGNQVIRDHLINDRGVDLDVIVSIHRGNRTFRGKTFSLKPTTWSIAIEEEPEAIDYAWEAMIRNDTKIYYSGTRNGAGDYSTDGTFSETENTDPVDGEDRWKYVDSEIDESIGYAPTITINYTLHHYADDGSGNIVDTVTTGESVEFDIDNMICSVIRYKENGSDIVRSMFIHKSYYLDIPNDLKLSIDFSPIFQLKRINGRKKWYLNETGVEFDVYNDIKGEATEDELAKIKRENDLLDEFGLDLDSVQGYIDNKKISDYRVGLALSPIDIRKHSSICKYFYEFFSELVPKIEDTNDSASNVIMSINSDEGYGLLNMQTRFKLNYTVETGAFPKPNDFKERRVKLKRIMSNKDMYYDIVKSIYDSSIGGSLTEIKSMYRAVEDNRTNDPESYSKLPPSEDFYLESTGSIIYAYAFSTVDGIEEAIHDDMYFDTNGDPSNPDFKKIYDIFDYKEFRTTKVVDTDSLFHEVTEREIVTEEDDGVGGTTQTTTGDVEIKIYKKISHDSYEVYTVSRLKLDYAIDGKIAKLTLDSTKSKLRLFVKKGTFGRGKGYREHVSLYNSALVGIGYSQETVKVKFYQRAGFAMLLQFVAIVASMFTGGLTGGLVALAQNLAVAYAIGRLAMYIAKKIGGTIGAIVGAIVAVAIAFYMPGSTMELGDINLWLKLAGRTLRLQSQLFADEAVAMKKDYDEFTREIREKEKLLNDSMMEDYSSSNSISRESILNNINEVRSDNVGILSGYGLTMDIIEELDDNSWRNEDVSQVDYHQAESMYNSIYKGYGSESDQYLSDPIKESLDDGFGDTTTSKIRHKG